MGRPSNASKLNVTEKEKTVKPKTTTTKTSVKTTEVVGNVALIDKVEQAEQNKSYEYLENKINSLESMIASLVSAIKVNNDTQNNVAITSAPIQVKPQIVESDEEYVEIPPNKRIPVISLCYGMLNLTTEQNGNGKPFTFAKFGDMHNINYSDLQDILHYNQKFAKQGIFYIDNRNVVVNNGLQDVYSKILSKEQIDNLFTYDNSCITKLFTNTTEIQRDNIVAVLIEKIHRNDESVDLNKIDILSKVYGKNIIEMANNVYDYTSTEE